MSSRHARPFPSVATPAALARLPAALLRAGAFGLEREALRVSPAGRLALTPHPAEFGDKLLNPRITVDFSESQLEMVTSPHPSVAAALAELTAIHDEVEEVLERHDERLWPFSMPPALPADPEIPIARFGPASEGRDHELYRIGLGHRYGRKRQMISGVHFSFSFAPALLAALPPADSGASAAEFRDAAYFRTARNFLRHRWLVLYLTGASPAADASFDGVVDAHVGLVRSCCPGCCAQLAHPDHHAISLRMSRHGYADTAFATMPVSFNSRADYVADIRRLLATRSERFAKLGLVRHGARVQVNDRVLQRESEFYAAIRLKGRIARGESHLDAMAREGVHYAEVRVFDIDPFAREGISLPTLEFLQVFLLDCLLGESAPLLPAEWGRAQENHQRVALFGRRADLRLRTMSGETPVLTLAQPIFARLNVLAARMDDGLSGRPFSAAVQAQWARFLDPAELPAARIHAALQRRQLDHTAYGTQLLMPATPALKAIA